MNVIISNKSQVLLGGLSIDVIKSINGVFTVEDLDAQFKNFFFNKMIIDITALENYEDINTIQKLSFTFDTNKIILLLDDSIKVNSAVYLSQLVSMGLYNFTKDITQIPYLIQNSNTYKDVAQYQMLNMTTDEIANSENAAANVKDFVGQKIIGVKNITEHAGASTLCYVLKNHLEKLYKTKAVEINKHDFGYLNDDKLEAVEADNFVSFLERNKDIEAILVDMNDADVVASCTDVIYLIEPGLIQLNRLIRQNEHIFDDIQGKKIVLNRSLLNQKDVEDFERESLSKVFFNIPNIDDKQDDIKEIKKLLLNLGFTRFSNEKKSHGFNLFK